MPRKFHTLPSRWVKVEANTASGVAPAVVCECELVTRSDLRSAIDADAAADLDDLRRDLRLGMGPCQAAFCGYRAADELARRGTHPPGGSLGRFLEERWRGTHMLAWGHMLRQIEFHQRVSRELLGVPSGEEEQ
jgi:glycerol-3-phosphate dehydrogenase